MTMPRTINAGSRLERYDSHTRDGDLLTRHVFTANERFAVMLGGMAALSLDTDSLAREFGTLIEEGVDPGLAEDILVQMVAYIGYPRAAAALSAFRRADPRPQPVDDAHALSDGQRYEAGTAAYAQVNGTALAAIRSAFGDLAGEMIDLTFRSFGDVFATSRQPLPLRQLATVTALAVLGGAAPQLRFHICGALAVGVTQRQLVEAFIWVQYLAGMPAAYNALVELKQALAGGSNAPPAYE
jgi:4-carboxymuconolactone decarboxylase